MDKNELKKELIKTKVMAEFAHYCAGNLYYRVATQEGTFQFPIATVEPTEAAYLPSKQMHVDVTHLSSDLGTTAFPAREKASMLWRWIDKAIDAGEFLKVN